MSNTSLSFPEARAVVLYFCKDFQENLPVDGYTNVELDSLTRRLSYYLEAEVKTYDLESVISRFQEFADLESGDHEDLVQTANGAIDEAGQVRDRLDSQLRDDLYFTVTRAGIDPTLRAVAA